MPSRRFLSSSAFNLDSSSLVLKRASSSRSWFMLPRSCSALVAASLRSRSRAPCSSSSSLRMPSNFSCSACWSWWARRRACCLSFSALNRTSSCCWQMFSMCCCNVSILSCSCCISPSFSPPSCWTVCCNLFSNEILMCSLSSVSFLTVSSFCFLRLAMTCWNSASCAPACCVNEAFISCARFSELSRSRVRRHIWPFRASCFTIRSCSSFSSCVRFVSVASKFVWVSNRIPSKASFSLRTEANCSCSRWSSFSFASRRTCFSSLSFTRSSKSRFRRTLVSFACSSLCLSLINSSFNASFFWASDDSWLLRSPLSLDTWPNSSSTFSFSISRNLHFSWRETLSDSKSRRVCSAWSNSFLRDPKSFCWSAHWLWRDAFSFSTFLISSFSLFLSCSKLLHTVSSFTSVSCTSDFSSRMRSSSNSNSPLLFSIWAMRPSDSIFCCSSMSRDRYALFMSSLSVSSSSLSRLHLSSSALKFISLISASLAIRSSSFCKNIFSSSKLSQIFCNFAFPFWSLS